MKTKNAEFCIASYPAETEGFEPHDYSINICLEISYLQDVTNLKIFLVSEITATSNNT